MDGIPFTHQPADPGPLSPAQAAAIAALLIDYDRRLQQREGSKNGCNDKETVGPRTRPRSSEKASGNGRHVRKAAG